MAKIAVILHKRNSYFPYYAVIQQFQKSHNFVENMCRLTALGFVAIGNLGNVARGTIIGSWTAEMALLI